MKYLLIFALSLFIFSCSDQDGGDKPSTEHQQALDEGLQGWQAKGLENYIYSYRKQCFCPLGEEITITVISSQVSSAVYSATQAPVSEQILLALPTIDDIFDYAQTAIDNNAYEIKFEFNTELNYPELVSIDKDQYTVDEEISYSVSELKPLELSQQQLDLMQQRELWQGLGIDEYSFRYKKVCECAVEEDYMIKVVDAEVVSALHIPSNSPVTDIDLIELPSIDKLFTVVQNALISESTPAEVAYNNQYGFPESIINPDQHAIDGAITYQVLDFQVSDKVFLQVELEKKQKTWSGLGIENYNYRYQQICWCFPQLDIIVNVVDNQVDSAYYTSSQTLVQESDLNRLSTIDELFDIARTALAEDSHVVGLRYDSLLSFPIRIDLDIDQMEVDGGVSHIVSELNY